jgi:hypothetical protein
MYDSTEIINLNYTNSHKWNKFMLKLEVLHIFEKYRLSIKECRIVDGSGI